MSSSTSKAPDSPVDPTVSSSSIGAPEASPCSESSPVSPWLAPSASGPLNACVRLPGSKSQSARFLYLAAVASGPSRLRGVLDSRDTRLLASALETLGAHFESEEEGAILVHPLDLHACLGEARVAIECGLAGTVMRFLPPLAALFHTPVRFDGDPAARRRPLAPLLDTLSHLGAQIEFEGEPGFLPFTVTGPLRAPADGVLRVDASASSQFLSAMLLLAPLLVAPLIVEAPGRVVSLPHVEMTCEALRRCGCVVEQINEDGSEPLSWRVLPGAPRPQELSVEPDLSNAGPFLAAAMICGGRVRVQDWPEHTRRATRGGRSLPTWEGSSNAKARTCSSPDPPEGVSEESTLICRRLGSSHRPSRPSRPVRVHPRRSVRSRIFGAMRLIVSPRSRTSFARPAAGLRNSQMAWRSFPLP